MIIIEVAGGLGNQLQQYALYKSFLARGTDAALDMTWFESNAQPGRTSGAIQRDSMLPVLVSEPFTVADKRMKEAVAGKDDLFSKAFRKLTGRSKVFTESGMFHPEIFSMTDCLLKGYFACDAYYRGIFPELRRIIRFPECADALTASKNEAVMEQMRDPSEASVSIHIRRGDYLDPVNAALFGGICTDEYYEGAVLAVRQALKQRGDEKKLHFYVFSDDPEYAGSLHFGEKDESCTLIDWNSGANSIYDMMLMSCCRHNISANSTFSFWGARLNPDPEKIIVRPLKHKNTQDPDPDTMHRLWEGWILVDARGTIY